MLNFLIVVLKYISVMKKIDRWKKKTTNYLYDHINLKNVLSISKATLLATIAAFIYAFAFVCFITPTAVDPTTFAGSSVITGGVGGFSQVITQIINLCGFEIDPQSIKTFQSIFYFVLNIPILAFAFFKIGKKFALISLVNVGLSSLFIQLVGRWDLMNQVAATLSTNEFFLVRIIFAAAFVGFASAIAYAADVSCGGVDVVSYYFALRKSTSVGKYTMALNAVIITTYTCLTLAVNKGNASNIVLLNLLFSIIYLLICSLVIDFINVRNKKVQIQIITENDAISPVLIANFPHSNTVFKGHGGYLHGDKTIIFMVASSNETARIIETIKKIDPNAFITVTSLQQAYGNFFIKPVE